MDHAKLRSYLATVAPEKGRIESYAQHVPIFESAVARSALESVSAETDVTDALQAAEREQPLTAAQAHVLEAIVLPKERPVVDVVDGTFDAPDEPFTHLGQAEIQERIGRVLPSVGRIELPGHPFLPFGGTAFVVGDGLLMTNRHVAELFATGLGREGLSLLVGRDAGIDFLCERDRAESLFFDLSRIVMIHPYWDMALLAVTGLPAAQRALTLSTAEPGDLVDREVVVIGYPALDPRNNVDLQREIFRGVFNVKRLQPGRIGERAEIKSFEQMVMSLTHDCSTLGGNSGSAAIDVETGTVLALHFAGRYLEANYAVPAHALSLDGRVVDAGVNFDADVRPAPKIDWGSFWDEADAPQTPGEATTATAAATDSRPSPAAAAPSEQRITVNVPLEISVRLGGPAAVAGAPVVAGTEAMVEPFRDDDLGTRTGYDDMFLGARLPLPKVRSGVPVSKLDDGSTELRYEHFSAVMNKGRRLAHFLAANVDGRPAKTRPEPGRDYSREGLSGLRTNDREKWFTDPRIPAVHQLPDRFFNRDRQSFDKGHIIRRTYVAWGDSYDEVRRANGDTYHVTNCSPQVAAFNRSNKQGMWGRLENLIQEQAAAETYSIIAGPIFRDDDPPFEGVDDRGRTTIQIPQTFWKIIVARSDAILQAFAFELDQDLSGVDFTELAFDAEWETHMLSIADLEAAIGTLRFPDVLHDSDQSGTDHGENVRKHAGVEMVPT